MGSDIFQNISQRPKAVGTCHGSPYSTVLGFQVFNMSSVLGLDALLPLLFGHTACQMFRVIEGRRRGAMTAVRTHHARSYDMLGQVPKGEG